MAHAVLLVGFDPDDLEGQQPSVDGGIPLTLAINVLIMFIVWVLYHCLRPHYPRFFYPRVWVEGYVCICCCCCRVVDCVCRRVGSVSVYNTL